MSEWKTVEATGDAWDEQKPIQGVFTSTKTDVGPNKANMYMLDTEDGLKGVWGSTVLDSKFEQIPRHSEVRVEYLGKAKSKAGKEYKDYKVQYKPSTFKEVDDVFAGSEEL